MLQDCGGGLVGGRSCGLDAGIGDGLLPCWRWLMRWRGAREGVLSGADYGRTIWEDCE